MMQRYQAGPGLVIAPPRVVDNVWRQEVEAWAEFADVEVHYARGTQAKRLEVLREARPGLTLLSCDSVAWKEKGLPRRLTDLYPKGRVPWSYLIIDESTKFKTWGSDRTKALRKFAPLVPYRVCLTGTPMPNGLEDLFPQVYLMDKGEALGTGVSRFRQTYFHRGGYGSYDWIANEGSFDAVQDRIKHLVYRLDAETHLDLPQLVVNDVWVSLPAAAAKVYKQLENELFAELDSGSEIVPLNAGGKYGSCRQIANGGVYTYDPTRRDAKDRPIRTGAEDIHNAKIDAIADLREELHGKPLLVAYQYKHDAERLRKRFKRAVHVIGGETSPKEATNLINRWNAGSLDILAVQPQGMSHGINLQKGPGRDLVWLGCPDDPEVYEQMNRRIYRSGVTGPQVRIHRILAKGTVDRAIVNRLEAKQERQRSLLDWLQDYRKGIE